MHRSAGDAGDGGECPDLSHEAGRSGNEAFAPVPLARQIETGADDGTLNPLGGSGAILTTRLVHHMRDQGIRHGLQPMCEAGGLANATVLELL